MLLVKNGDASSLQKLRTMLGKSLNEIASLISVGAEDLEKWEKGEAQPTSLKHAYWKLKLADFVDAEIARFLGTDNPEVVTPFWRLIWTLNSDFW
jgi:transcriptional regulator with XRE-family HTH domain